MLGDEFEEHVDQENGGGHCDGNSKSSGPGWLSLKDRSEQPSEASEELNDDNDQEDQPGHEVGVEVCESVQFGGADITAVDQVEELEEDEGIEDQGEVFHLIMALWGILDGLGGIGVVVADD